jgi:hypothetical protein
VIDGAARPVRCIPATLQRVQKFCQIRRENRTDAPRARHGEQKFTRTHE